MFKVGDKVFCNKRNLNGEVVDFQSDLFTILFENKSYGRYTVEKMLADNRFVLFEAKPLKNFENVVFVDFANKKMVG